ncbi:type I DNA topoisomerase [Candidatus Riflebacteria bacterium]
MATAKTSKTKSTTKKKSLIIVESAGKIKTLQKLLGPDFRIEACVGHIRDLPKKKLNVDIENDFEPNYEIMVDKRKVVNKLIKASKEADRVYLAPDPDREGEAIAWHLSNVLKIDPEKTCRITYNSITSEVVQRALENPTVINIKKFQAQQARRILDRLVGYKLSPLLWKKVQRGLSAGRVQSVAVMLIVDREREIQAFIPEEFWHIFGDFKLCGQENGAIKAQLTKKDGKILKITSGEDTEKIQADLKNLSFEVSTYFKREKKQAPAPPFITSTLQQEAARKFGFSAKKTMVLAQKLYEGVEIDGESVGLITYMRTDSVRVEPTAIKFARTFIKNEFGENYLYQKDRHFKTKKGAQDAHEAIRPTNIDFKPERIKNLLVRDLEKLYTLIWKRFIATQMADAKFDALTLELTGGPYVLKSTGSRLIFDGYRKLYLEGVDDDAEPKNGQKSEDIYFPTCSVGDKVDFIDSQGVQNFTKPAPRYSDATIVKSLEKEGIGRPSTYATIIDTILNRNFVEKIDKKFYPTVQGLVTSDYLKSHFNNIINLKFTAQMEDALDLIEEGKANWRELLRNFYFPFENDIKRIEKSGPKVQIPTDATCELCSSPLILKLSSKGRFLACTSYPKCKNTINIPLDFPLKDHLLNNRDKTIPVNKLIPIWKDVKEKKTDLPESTDKLCDKCSSPMVIRKGRFGKFIACSAFPKCKNTIKLSKTGQIEEKPSVSGIPCLKKGCDGTILTRKGRWGKEFYGCNKYPKCNFISGNKPTGEFCSNCKTFTVYKTTKKLGKHISCSNKDCDFIQILNETNEEKPQTNAATS